VPPPSGSSLAAHPDMSQAVSEMKGKGGSMVLSLERVLTCSTDIVCQSHEIKNEICGIKRLEKCNAAPTCDQVRFFSAQDKFQS